MTARCWASPSANPELKLGQNNHKKIVPGCGKISKLLLIHLNEHEISKTLPIMANVSDV
jgi:hypothetical protein